MKQSGVLIALIVFIAAVSVALTTEQRRAGSHTLKSTLSSPRKDNAGGEFRVALNVGRSQVCYGLSVHSVGAPTAAQIRAGKVNEAGPVVVSIPTPANDFSNQCLTVDTAHLQDIAENPDKYYVNVTTQEFPDGALQGQLGK